MRKIYKGVGPGVSRSRNVGVGSRREFCPRGKGHLSVHNIVVKDAKRIMSDQAPRGGMVVPCSLLFIFPASRAALEASTTATSLFVRFESRVRSQRVGNFYPVMDWCFLGTSGILRRASEEAALMKALTGWFRVNTRCIHQ